jgi:hypothetical protein
LTLLTLIDAFFPKGDTQQRERLFVPTTIGPIVDGFWKTNTSKVVVTTRVTEQWRSHIVQFLLPKFITSHRVDRTMLLANGLRSQKIEPGTVGACLLNPNNTIR